MITVIAVSAALLEYYELKNCLLEKASLEEQLGSYRHMVYVAAEKLPKGTILTEEKLYQEIRYLDLPPSELLTEEAIGKAVAIDIPEGTCLTTAMLYTAESNVREIFLSEIEIPDYVESGDRVDIRIRYKNAEEYVVLADKILVKCDPGNGMVLELTEEELLLMSSAIADNVFYDGTKLYAVRYPEYEHTEVGTVNYIANQEILALLGREKTEGESRTALERRLMQEK